jgi:Mrp family chromosome partitioning ATPase
VIVDTAPMLAVSDAVPLLAAVDGVLLVGRIGHTTRDAVERLVELVRRVPDVHVLGAVANDVPQVVSGYGGYSAYYGAPK